MDDFEDSARALQALAEGSAVNAADDLARAFEAAGDRISSALERAARSGEFSFNDLASSVAQDLTRLAFDEITGPITNALTGALGGALGGLSGGSSNRNTTVNLNVSGMNNTQGLQRSQGQISAAVARAVASGQRYI